MIICSYFRYFIFLAEKASGGQRRVRETQRQRATQRATDRKTHARTDGRTDGERDGGSKERLGAQTQTQLTYTE